MGRLLDLGLDHKLTKANGVVALAKYALRTVGSEDEILAERSFKSYMYCYLT